MIIIIGGIIVASVLVFIFILLMKYKLHSNHYKQKAAARHANVCSQTNGGGGGGNPSSSSAGQGKRRSRGVSVGLSPSAHDLTPPCSSSRWSGQQKLLGVTRRDGGGLSAGDDCSGLKPDPRRRRHFPITHEKLSDQPTTPIFTSKPRVPPTPLCLFLVPGAVSAPPGGAAPSSVSMRAERDSRSRPGNPVY